MHETIVFTCQHRLHALLAVDDLFQYFRDFQRDGFFLRTHAAGRARVLAAVAGIDRDDHVAQFFLGDGFFWPGFVVEIEH